MSQGAVQVDSIDLKVDPKPQKYQLDYQLAYRAYTARIGTKRSISTRNGRLRGRTGRMPTIQYRHEVVQIQ